MEFNGCMGLYIGLAMCREAWKISHCKDLKQAMQVLCWPIIRYEADIMPNNLFGVEKTSCNVVASTVSEML